MENATMNCPQDAHQLQSDHQEVFERVWRRVMESAGKGAAGAGCGDLPCVCVTAGEKEGDRGELAPAALSQQPSPHRGLDFPEGGESARLGPGSAAYGKQLQRQIADALESWQLYRYLARRSGGDGRGRMLSAMASEKHKAARKLAAAYFLVSGVRFWPVDRLAAPDIPSYLGSIRRAYLAEQQREQAYLLAGDDTTDTALAELYRDLAELSRGHGELLRAILEQSRF